MSIRMNKKRFRAATRSSKLAIAQAKQIIDQLKSKHPDIDIELVEFSTSGDRNADQPLTDFGGTGVFVKELENALLNNEADFAVHSLKDVPGSIPDDLFLASFPKREIANDLILTKNNRDTGKTDKELLIGTGSPRRRLQLANIYPTATFKDIRGNIDTRLKKLRHGEYDAIVLAVAGLKRLGADFPVSAIIPVDQCIPAIGQGVIALECRKNDQATIEMLHAVNDEKTFIAVLAERAFMRKIEGGCRFPLAAHAWIEYNNLIINSMAGNEKLNRMAKLKRSFTLDNPEKAGSDLAEALIELCNKQHIPLHF